MIVRKILVAAALALGATAASASLIQFTFTANGQNDQGISQQGTAVFKFDTTDLTSFSITLTDNVAPTAKIASELDGFNFSFSQAPTSLSLDSVSAVAVVDCTGATDPCPAPNFPTSSPYGWGTTRDGMDLTLGAGFTGSGYSYHPYAIVNASYDAPGGQGGVSNQQHNPLLIGPVVFTFSVEGLTSIPDISSVSFLFGTVPDSQTGECAPGTTCDPPICTNGDCGDQNVPEPHSGALLGLALLAAAWVSRRMRNVRAAG